MTRSILYLVVLIFSFPAYAYIDPGLGSLILQSFIGGLAVALGFVSVFWQKIKSFIFKFRKKPENDKLTKNENHSR